MQKPEDAVLLKLGQRAGSLQLRISFRMKQHETPLVDMIRRLREEIAGGDLTLGEVFDILKTSGHSVVMIFLCLPFLQPIPIPGLSTPLGILVGLVAIMQMLNREPWIPVRWKKHNFAGPVVKRILEIAETAAAKVSPWIYPRWDFVISMKPMRLLNAAIIVISGILLALPLPIPFSNTVPSLVIIFQALGTLEKDGALVVLSWILFGLCLAFFVGIGVGVESSIDFFA